MFQELVKKAGLNYVVDEYDDVIFRSDFSLYWGGEQV